MSQSACLETVLDTPIDCDLCSRPVDLSARHVTVLRHIEREDAFGNPVVLDQVTLSVQHEDCTALEVACTLCHRGFATYAALSLHRCSEMSAAA
jgi:hypothetical protein